MSTQLIDVGQNGKRTRKVPRKRRAARKRKRRMTRKEQKRKRRKRVIEWGR